MTTTRRRRIRWRELGRDGLVRLQRRLGFRESSAQPPACPWRRAA